MKWSACHNVFTVDLEEWYHGLEPDRNLWPNYERRSRSITERLMRILSDHDIKATFFVLGDVAGKSPGLVREIAAEGHEIGSHGMYHEFVYRQTPDEFRRDLRKSLDMLASITGTRVQSYRAPYFSITDKSMWALDILKEEGINYDSSVFPVHNPRYGIPDAPRLPYRIIPGLWEWPVATMPSILGNIPFGGGFYFRFWPLIFTRYALHSAEKRQEPVLIYFHPWEFDPAQPRIRTGSRFSSLRHYFRLDNNFDKLKRMLSGREYTTLSNAICSIATTAIA
jgi:polysaccharide deacetylase family protein (PEP-CTERM system associated)